MIFFYLLVSGMPLVNQTLFAHFLSDLTTVKYLGLASLIYACVHLALRRTPAVAMRGPLAMLFTAFYLLAAISHFTLSLPTAWDMSPFLSFTSFLLLLFIVTALIDSPQRLRYTVLVAVASVGLGSVYMVREWLQYHSVYKDFRPGWVVGDSNYFTLSALLCIPLAYFLLQAKRPTWERLFLIGCLGLTIIAVALGASRGGLVGLTAESGFFVWRSRRRTLNLAIVIVLLAAATALAPISSMTRLLHPDYSDIAAENNRLVVWHGGLHMIERHPITGVGLGNFKPLVVNYEDAGPTVQSLAHNTYIEIAAELGLPGLGFFLAILLTGYLTAAQALHRIPYSHGVTHQAALGLQAGLIGCAIAMVFLSADNQKLLWLMLFLTPCVDALAVEEAEATEATEARLVSFRAPATAEASAADDRSASAASRARELAEIFR